MWGIQTVRIGHCWTGTLFPLCGTVVMYRDFPLKRRALDFEVLVRHIAEA